MRVVFHGMKEKRKRGCRACGSRSTEFKTTTVKSFRLPSGITQTFRKGKAEEVSDLDGEYLLQYEAFTHDD